MLIVLSLPVSFAYRQDVPIVSCSEALPDYFSDSNHTVFVGCGYFPNTERYTYLVFDIPLPASQLGVRNGFILSRSAASFSVVEYTLDGTVYSQYTAQFIGDNSVWNQPFPYGYGSVLAQINGNSGGLYFYLPSGMTVVENSSSFPFSNEFIRFSSLPAEHNIYHSELSEPFADEYNSYFICNDKLYWLSYRANGLYAFDQNIEVTSSVYSESASYESSGSGSFSGQSGGSTETVTAPYVIVSGSVSNGEVFNGSASSPNFGEIDYVGSSQGNLTVSSNGQITYNGLNVYPVAINNQILNRLYDVIIYLTDSSGFKIWLCPRSDLGTSLVVDASLFCSVFELTNGQYVSSSFSSYTGSYDHAGFDFPLEDEIADVRCYGCAFYNVNNIPVGLSDVLWAYDLEFVQWRDSMLDKLNQIYSLLSNASVPETTTYSFGEAFENMSNPDFSELSPDQMGVDLNNVWHDSGDSLVSGSSTVKGWMSAFSIPKIISLCVLALATGTVILTLGKNKQDSA